VEDPRPGPARAGGRLEASRHQGSVLKRLITGQLQELFHGVRTVMHACPEACPRETAGPTPPESAERCGHGNTTFGRRTSRSTGSVVFCIDISALSQKDLVDVLAVEREVLRTAKAQSSDGGVRIGPHTRAEGLKSGGIEGGSIGMANEVVGRDHTALVVEGQWHGGATFGARMRLAARDGSGIKGIE